MKRRKEKRTQCQGEANTTFRSNSLYIYSRPPPTPTRRYINRSSPVTPSPYRIFSSHAATLDMHTHTYSHLKPHFSTSRPRPPQISNTRPGPRGLGGGGVGVRWYEGTLFTRVWPRDFPKWGGKKGSPVAWSSSACPVADAFAAGRQGISPDAPITPVSRSEELGCV